MNQVAKPQPCLATVTLSDTSRVKQNPVGPGTGTLDVAVMSGQITGTGTGTAARIHYTAPRVEAYQLKVLNAS
jgi:hypothetical protein